MISLNGPVKAALDDWLTWNRPMLMSSYEYYQYLRDNDRAHLYVSRKKRVFRKPYSSR